MSRLMVPILLILGILFSVYLVSQRVGFFSQAAPELTPRKVAISNIADSGFTVSWVTDKPTIGFVKYSKDSSFNQTESDDRDSNGPKMRTTHFVSLKNLATNQNYLFKIASSEQLFADGDQPFQQKTAPVSEETPLLPVLTFGKLKKKNHQLPKEAIVYLRLPQSTLLSAYTQDEGNWLVTLTNARKADLSGYVSAKDGDLAQIWAEAGEDGNLSNSQINISSSQAVPDLILEEPVKPTQSPVTDSVIRDFNNDGKINAFDFAIWIKKVLNLP